MKLNRKWLLVIALVMSLTVATASTLAYLTDRDTEVNTFTMGNVDIELKEDFEQDSELLPGINIEKEPTITNIGKNDAWVWATIAIPAALDSDDASENVLHFNMSKESVADGKWTWWAEGSNKSEWLKEYDVEYEGVKYNVFTVLYQTALKKGETTEPVIYKVYMDVNVDIKPDGQLYHVEKGVAKELDWNINTDGNPKMYVSAYAMQTDEFDNVYDAYDAYTAQWDKDSTKVDADDYEWGEDDGVTDTPIIPNGIYTLQDLIDAAKTGGEYVLSSDLIITEENAVFSSGRKLNVIWEDLTIDLNGHNISVDLGNGEYADASNPPTLFYVYNNATLTIVGDGNLSATNDACLIWASSKSGGTNIYGGNFFNNNLSTGNPNKPNDSMAIIYSSGGRPVNVYGGTFAFEVNAENGDNTGFNLQDSSSYVDQIVLHEGVLLSSDNYAWRLDVGRINLAEGCELKEVVIDGATWYEVVKQ